LLAFAACTSKPGSSAPPSAADASPDVDAASFDTSTADVSAAVDATTVEGSVPDAAAYDAIADAALPDAASSDATAAVDAPTVDASEPEASPPLGAEGAACATPISPPILDPCQPNLQCLGGICTSGGPGGYCNDNSQCVSQAGCGGPFIDRCNTADRLCECTCTCAVACSECAAPVGTAGSSCGRQNGIDPNTGTWYVACAAGLTCVDSLGNVSPVMGGTCVTPDAAVGEQ
jgi:hypothetical protein